MPAKKDKLSFSNPIRENLSLAIYNSGYENCFGNHCWGPGTRDHYLIHYVCCGKGRFCIGEKTYTLRQGDLFIIYPSQVVTYIADKNDPWEYSWVGFNGTEANRLITLTGLSKKEPILHLPQVDRYKLLLKNIYDSSGNSPSADSNMIGYLYLFLGQLINDYGENRTTYHTRDYVAQSLKYIQYNYSSDIGVSDIAYYVGISRSQLYRSFNAAYNISPSDFLQQYRINKACSMLRSGNFSVTEIANSVGFSDPLYFSRVFKKIKGVSPSFYQEEIL